MGSAQSPGSLRVNEELTVMQKERIMADFHNEGDMQVASRTGKGKETCSSGTPDAEIFVSPWTNRMARSQVLLV